MSSLDLRSMSPEEIRELGHKIGEISFSEPHITHHFLLGVRDGMKKKGILPQGYDFGDSFFRLWYGWFRFLADKKIMVGSFYESHRGKMKTI